MKKIFSFIISIILLTIFALSICLTFIAFNKTETKKIKISDSRIVQSNLVFKQEQELLDSNLKKNENVLLLYYETNEEVSKEKEKMIIENYTKEEIPYVIFVYNPDEQTLKTVSSNKKILDFEDISIENVSSYTEIYRYISDIDSNVMVTYVSQHSLELLWAIIAILYMAIFSGISIYYFIEQVNYSLYWQGKNTRNYLYRNGFWERGYKVKINPNAKDVIAMYANVPIVNGKDYFYILKSNKKKNKIMIETEYEIAIYKAVRFVALGLMREKLILKFDSNASKIQKIKDEYKYCIKKEEIE